MPPLNLKLIQQTFTDLTSKTINTIQTAFSVFEKRSQTSDCQKLKPTKWNRKVWWYHGTRAKGLFTWYYEKSCSIDHTSISNFKILFNSSNEKFDINAKQFLFENYNSAVFICETDYVTGLMEVENKAQTIISVTPHKEYKEHTGIINCP